MDQFNKMSKEITTCQLFQEMSRLVCLYSSNLLKAKVILAAENDLRTLSLDSGGQVFDENLGIGNNTWVLLQLEESDSKPLYSAIRQFCEFKIKRQKRFALMTLS